MFQQAQTDGEEFTLHLPAVKWQARRKENLVTTFLIAFLRLRQPPAAKQELQDVHPCPRKWEMQFFRQTRSARVPNIHPNRHFKV